LSPAAGCRHDLCATLVAVLSRRRPTASRAAAVTAEVERVLAGKGPVLAGPWRGDLGYELLYWIPFLQRLVDDRPELRSRLVAVSRGGVASWYARVTDRYLDGFELLPLDRMRELAGGKGRVVGEKQREVDELDRALLEEAARTLGGRTMSVLSPTLVNPLMRLTKRDDPSGEALLRFTPLAAPERPSWLPERYVAVRFYANSPLPRRPETVHAIERVARAIGDLRPVVLLGHDLGLDGHYELLDPRALPNAITIAERVEPRTNLALQTAVIAGAEAFVGTYGGLSYLAPRLGVPSIGFYSEPAQVNPVYLRLAQRAASLLGVDYYALALTGSPELELLGAVAAGVRAPR
jgi:hypothetical protein